MPSNDWSNYFDNVIPIKGTAAPAAPIIADNGYLPGDAEHPYIRASIEHEIRNLSSMGPQSGRNSALNNAAIALGRWPINRAHLRELLIGACVANGVLAEDGQAQCDATITSGFSKADREGPRTIPVQKVNGHHHLVQEVSASTLTGTGPDTETEVEAGFHFIDGATFILTIPDVIPALWGTGQDVLWAEGESLMIAGPMGLGKTTLAGQLIRAQLGIENDVLGLPVAPREGKILYLAMDRPAQIARAFARQFDESHYEQLVGHLTIWKGPPPADIAKNPTLLTYLAQKAGAETVYVDSLKDAALGLSDDTVGAGYNRARQHVLANGIQLAELHHTVKRNATGGPPNHVADVYGSAWLTNGTGSIILLGGEPGDPIVSFKHPRQPANEVGPFQLLHDQAAGLITVHHAADLVEMVGHCGPEGLTAKAAAMALFDTDRPTRGQVEKARRKLERLSDIGEIVCCEGVRGRGDGTSATWFPALGGAS